MTINCHNFNLTTEALLPLFNKMSRVSNVTSGVSGQPAFRYMLSSFQLRLRCLRFALVTPLNAILSPVAVADKCWHAKKGTINLLDVAVALIVAPIFHLLSTVRYLLAIAFLNICWAPLPKDIEEHPAVHSPGL